MRHRERHNAGLRTTGASADNAAEADDIDMLVVRLKVEKLGALARGEHAREGRAGPPLGSRGELQQGM